MTMAMPMRREMIVATIKNSNELQELLELLHRLGDLLQHTDSLDVVD